MSDAAVPCDRQATQRLLPLMPPRAKDDGKQTGQEKAADDYWPENNKPDALSGDFYSMQADDFNKLARIVGVAEADSSCS